MGVKRRKPREQRRNETVPVRMSLAEKRRLSAAARRRGVGLSSWLRQLGLEADAKE